MAKTRPAGRTAAFMSNSLSSLLLQLVNIVVGLIVSRTLIAVYGSSTNRLVTSLTQMVGYIQLVEAGISSAAVFQLYAPLARNDNDGVSRIVSATKGFYYRSGGIFTALMLALAAIYPFLVDVGEMSRPEVFVLVLALGATAFLDFFTLARYRVLLTATQKNWVIQISTVVYKVLYAAVVVALAVSGTPSPRSTWWPSCRSASARSCSSPMSRSTFRRSTSRLCSTDRFWSIQERAGRCPPESRTFSRWPPSKTGRLPAGISVRLSDKSIRKLIGARPRSA